MVLALLLAMPAITVHAQYHSIGTDPASARWMSIETDNYKVLFPRGNDSLARVWLYHFEKNRPLVDKGLNIDPQKLTIVLHPWSLSDKSGAFWTPARIDITTTPGAFLGNSATHQESASLYHGRQAGQMAHYTTGIYNTLYYLLGQQSASIGTGFYPSGWLKRGDAAQMATDFARGGKGHDPDYLMFFRASFLEGEYRTYDTWRYGSYRRYTPGKEPFGYMIQNDLRLHAESYDYMGRILKDFSYEWYNLGIWNTSFLRHTNNTGRKHYKASNYVMTSVWQSEDENRAPFTPVDTLSNYKNKYYSLYDSPLPAGDGNTVVLKSGMAHVPQLISIDSTGKEHFLRIFSDPSKISSIILKDDKTLLWSEIVPSVRWKLKENSILRSYDLESGQIHDLTRGTRYFNPAISTDGKMTSVTEYPVEGSSFLVILNSESRCRKTELLGRVEAPFKGQMRCSGWIGDRIYADVVTDDGWGVWSISVSDALEGIPAWSVEIPVQERSLQQLRAFGDKLMFRSDLDAIPNIYLYDPADKSLRRLTNTRFGASDPWFDEASQSLYYSVYDRKGDHPVSTHISLLDTTEKSFDSPTAMYLVDILAKRSRNNTRDVAFGPTRLDSLRSAINELPASRYSPLGHLVHIHSWAPFYAGIQRIMDSKFDDIYKVVAPGATIISQNLTGTAVSQVGYSWHGRHAGHFNLTYSGLWPVFEASVDYNDRARVLTRPMGIDTTDAPALEMSFAVSLPLDLSRSGWESALIPQIEYGWTNDRHMIGQEMPLAADCPMAFEQNLHASLRWYRVLPKTKSNIMPRLGYGVKVDYVNGMGGEGNSGKQLFGQAFCYLPGFSLQQGIKLTASFQRTQKDAPYGYLPNLLPMPRGCSKVPLYNCRKYTFDYAIPIYLGDTNLTGLIYLMRLKVVPFADYANESGRKLMSFGTAVLVDGHFFRIGKELTIGIRYSRCTDPVTLKWGNSFKVVTSTGLGI